MIKYKDKQYEAPFKPNKLGDKNLDKIYSIFSSSNSENLFAKMQTQASVEFDKKNPPIRRETDFGITYEPIYFEEFMLSKFVEDYLDFMIPKVYEYSQSI